MEYLEGIDSMVWVESSTGTAGLLLQDISPVLLLSVISTTATIIIVLVVVYLLRFSTLTPRSEEHQADIPADTASFFLLLKDWKREEYKTLLSSFLLRDEYMVLEQLLLALEEDGLTMSSKDEPLGIVGDGGWRNRNQIANQTGLSKRRTYGKSGIIDRLVELDLIEERESPRPWGNQTYQYRANTTHPLIKSMFHALNGK